MLPELDKGYGMFEEKLPSGCTTLDAAREIVALNLQAHTMQVRPYLHGCGDTEPPIALARDQFLSLDQTWLRQIESSLKDGWNLNLDSVVRDPEGNIRHIPMMDLHIGVTLENTRRVAKFLREVVVPKIGRAFLIESGRSYHVMGMKLILPSEWEEFISMDFTQATIGDDPIVSGKYFGYCKQQQHGCLRVTANGPKQVLPKVVAVI